MNNYPAIFHLRVARALSELEELKKLLEAMHKHCQPTSEGYKDITDTDLESLTILPEVLKSECHEAKRAMQWHREQEKK